MPRRTVILFCVAVVFLTAGCSLTAKRFSGTFPPGHSVWSGKVQIVGDVEIPDDAVVEVRPGAEILFMPAGENDRLKDHPHFPGSELIVRGRFLATGTAERPITFRYVDRDGSRGSWGGINLMASPEAVFSYCYFTQADSAIHSQESEVRISQSLFEENRVGVRFNRSNIVIENNRFRDNGAGIRFHFGAPVVRNNILENNHKGLFITSSPRSYEIRNNIFNRNAPYNVVLGETVSEDVDLVGNWWHFEAVSEFGESFFDRRRDSELGSVILEPQAQTVPENVGPSWNR